MACAVCNKNPSKPYTSGDYQTMWNTGDFSVVTWNGPGYPKLVGSPTGVIVQYNIRDYGRHKNGDIIIAHNNDISATPTLFILVEDEDVIAETLLAYDIEPGYEPVSLSNNSQSFTIEIGSPKLSDVVELDSVEEKEEIDEEVVDKVKEGLPRLKRSEAIKLIDFRDKYGYSHHLQVTAEVKIGKLNSFKKGKTTYIYHDDD